jgi:glycerophosphoryl diester phosphodiesterase
VVSTTAWVLAALLAVAVTGAISSATAQGRRPLVAAHRGGAQLWPENSLTAFRNALALGVDLLEADIHLTADGTVVVLHDPLLDRTTTGAGAIRALTTAEASRFRLRSADGHATDDPVPTLAQLLDLLKPSAAELLLEIKVDERARPYAGIEEKALALVRERQLAGRVMVMAFERETISRVRALDPAIRTVLLIGRGQVQRERVFPAESVKWGVALGTTAVGFNHRLIDADVVAACRKAGLRLAAWTPNTQPDIRRVLDLGVDIVISDRPDLARRLVGP